MAPAVEFKYAPMFQVGRDDTEYYLLTKDYVSEGDFEGRKILKVQPEALTMLARQCFHDANFMLRRKHNEQVASILKDPEASDNDKYVALTFLRNAEVSVKGELPFCQDTGTAIIHAEKGQAVWTGFSDEEALSLGVFQTYVTDNLRYSQNAPLSMYEEKNTKCNLPAQIDIEAVQGDEYRFLCVVKGGGSANKSFLFQETKAILNPGTLVPYLIEKIKTFGTSACPPYHIAIVIGGTTVERTMLTVKLASTHYYDNLPTSGDETGRAFRDLELEQTLFQAACNLGLGAQFGGKYSIFEQPYPICNETALIRDEIEYAIQVNSKIKTKILIAQNASEDEMRTLVLNHEAIRPLVEGKVIRKFIVVKDRLINVIV